MDFLIFYTKPDCPLCDEVREELDQAGLDWEEVNILEKPELFVRYRHEIPVVQSDRGSWFYRERETTPLARWLNGEG